MSKEKKQIVERLKQWPYENKVDSYPCDDSWLAADAVLLLRIMGLWPSLPH